MPSAVCPEDCPVTTLLPTTLVGSYPQPDWLIDRPRLNAVIVPRVRFRDLWRIAPEFLEQAQDDATVLAIRDQERAGIDIVSDGEMRRESYSNRFATALDGVDIDNPGQAPTRTPGKTQPVPRHALPARQHQPGDQDYRARAFHHVDADAGRLLQGRGRARDGLRRGGQ
jgi:5-methyltetrahydropteroyltriglutamate--homocysteine methyltransferase